jgi:hypothetical protein
MLWRTIDSWLAIRRALTGTSGRLLLLLRLGCRREGISASTTSAGRRRGRVTIG